MGEINYLSCNFIKYERKTSSINGKNYIAITIMLNDKTVTLYSKDCSMEEDLKVLSKFDNIKLGFKLSVYNDSLKPIPCSVELIS